MADIELVIKIPEDVYKKTIFYREFKDLNDCITTIKALEKSIPLPKGHGDLIDRQSLIDNGIEKGFCDWYDEIKMADTIIEAYKESEE